MMLNRVRIELLSGPATERRIDQTLPVTVGRQPECQLCLQVTGVSRQHCRLWSEGGTLYITDLDSTNGVYLFSANVAEPIHLRSATAKVHPEQEIVIGEARIRAHLLMPEHTTRSRSSSRDPFQTLDQPKRETQGSTEELNLLEQRANDQQAPATEAYDYFEDGIPCTLGQFKLQSKIGQGGMGTVYLARTADSNKDYAVKVLVSEAPQTDHEYRRILREMEISMMLRHRSIVQCICCERMERFLYIVMPYYNGGNLAQLLQRVGRLTVRRTLRLADRVLAGVEFAHQQGVVHRDLKPQNILLRKTADRSYVPLVSDFGLAKDYRTAGMSGITVAGMIGGSWGYIPREQLLDFRYVSPCSDVWSLGAMFFECLTGQLPRVIPPNTNPVHVVMQSMITPIHTLVPDLPQSVAEFITSSLAIEAADRFQDASEMREALRSVARQCSCEL